MHWTNAQARVTRKYVDPVAGVCFAWPRISKDWSVRESETEEQREMEVGRTSGAVWGHHTV